jgi:hypothetical protein
MTRSELQRVRNWADGKIATGEEPPWAWYQYMKLRETMDAILAGMDAAMPQTENSPREALRRETHLRLVDATRSPDTAQRCPLGEPVQLPM